MYSRIELHCSVRQIRCCLLLLINGFRTSDILHRGYYISRKCYFPSVRTEISCSKVDVLHVRLTELHAAHQNLPFPPDRALPLMQYQYQGRL